MICVPLIILIFKDKYIMATTINLSRVVMLNSNDSVCKGIVEVVCNNSTDFVEKTKLCKRQTGRGIFVFAVVFLLFFSACKEDFENVITNNENPLTTIYSATEHCMIAGLEYNLNDTLLLCDDMFTELGIAHNYYLEKFIENFNFDAIDYFIELERCILNADIPLTNLPLNIRNCIVNSFDTTCEYEKLISSINNIMSDTESVKLIEYLDYIKDSIITDTTLQYAYFCCKVNERVEYASNELSAFSMILLKSFTETLKASGYFWYPIERGGNGIGYQFIERILDSLETSKAKAKDVFLAPKKTNGALASALVADGSSMSFGMTVTGFLGAICPPATIGSVIGTVVASAMASGFAAATYNESKKW